MRDYEFRSAAQDEVLAAANWYIERNPDIANSFLDAPKGRIDQAMRFPNTGRRERRGCRSLPVESYPFRMVYRANGETIEIIAVAHTSRQAGYWKERL